MHFRKENKHKKKGEYKIQSSHQLQVLGENERENFYPSYLECDRNGKFTQGSFSSLQNPQGHLTQVSIPLLYTLSLITHPMVTALVWALRASVAAVGVDTPWTFIFPHLLPFLSKYSPANTTQEIATAHGVWGNRSWPLNVVKVQRD